MIHQATLQELIDIDASGYPGVPVVWVVGCVRPEGEPWEHVGVFSTRELAIEACTGPEYFVGPSPLDWRTPEETMPGWPGLFFPLAPSDTESI